MKQFAFLLFCLLAPAVTLAQLGGVGDVNLSLVLQPLFPSPNQSVTVSVNDFRSNSFGSGVRWLLDGSEVIAARNQRQVQITVGAAGSSQTVTAIITAGNGVESRVSTVVKPVYLDVIVEPQTRVPAFYQGRALPSIFSTVNVTALLNNGEMMTGDFVYTWRVNNRVVEDGPIRGRNRTSFITPQDSEVIVSVQVARPNGDTIAGRTFTIPSVLPELRFYEINTLYGINRKAITGNFNLIGNSATISAEPYFLDSLVFNNANINVWNIDGAEMPQSGNNPYHITIQRTGDPGQSSLGFHVRSTDIILQGARNAINVTF